MNKRTRRIYEPNLKLSYVLRYKNGKSCTILAKELRPDQMLKISRARIYQWVSAYNSRGMQALENNYKNNGQKMIQFNKNRKKERKKIDYSNWSREELIIANEIKDDWIKDIEQENKKRKFNRISTLRGILSLEKLCFLFEVSTSGYKNWFKTKKLENKYDDELLLLIKDIFFKHKRTFGIYRIHAEIKKEYSIKYERLNIKTVHRYMKYLKLKSVIRQRSKSREAKTTNRPFNNLINKNFYSETINQKWFTDTSYVLTKDGWGFLNVVLDSYNNSIVSWMFTNTNDLYLNIGNILKALHKTKAKPIINTDHHALYYSKTYFDMEREFKFKISKGEIGDSLSNRPVEYFFSIIKTECLTLNKTHNKTFEETKAIISNFMNYYSNERIQSSLNWKTPTEFNKSYNMSIGQF